jgi:hypothetical protein
MTMKLSTTLRHINTIPHSVNAAVVKEFYEYLKNIGTCESYRNQNLRANWLCTIFGKRYYIL